MKRRASPGAAGAADDGRARGRRADAHVRVERADGRQPHPAARARRRAREGEAGTERDSRLRRRHVLAARADRRARAPRGSRRVDPPDIWQRPTGVTLGCQNVLTGNGQVNVRANQDCSLRRQAEETIQINPTNERNIIAGQNDSRIGFNHCGYDWSFDGGKRWGDQVPPFWQFDAARRPHVGRLQRPDARLRLTGERVHRRRLLRRQQRGERRLVDEVERRRTAAASTTRPIRPAGSRSTATRRSASSRTTTARARNDKELMTADANPSSPKQDNVYMTWTRFNGRVIARSTSASPPTAVRRGRRRSRSAAPSAASALSGGPCNDDQGSHPVVGPDGTIYVSFAQRERARQRHRAGAQRDLPGQRRLQQPGELDGARPRSAT